MRKLIFIWLIGCTIGSMASGQSLDSAVWTLSAHQSAAVTGNIIGIDQSLTSLQVSYSSGVQRCSPIGTAGVWPAESAENSTRFMQFGVSPRAKYSLSVSSVSLFLFVNSGSGMRATAYYSKDSAFTTKTQIGTTFTLNTTIPSTPNVVASPNIDVGPGEFFYVRIYPWNIGATTGKYVITNNVCIAGTAQSSIAVLSSATTLYEFVQTANAPSAVQQYTISGTGLTNDVVITPPLNFEISIDSGSTWHNSASVITLAVGNGTVTGGPKTINVRLNSPTAGLSSGSITHSSTGAPLTEVAISGVRWATEPTTISSLAFSQVTGSSMSIGFTGGNGNNRIVVMHSGSVVSWVPADGIPVEGVDSNFTNAIDQVNGNKVVYSGPGTSVNVIGLSSNVQYYISVFEYNVFTGNSHNYLTTVSSNGIKSTLAVPTLSASKVSIPFGMVLVNTISAEITYTLSGVYLIPNAGNITVTAPSGYEISSTSGSGFATSLIVPYSGGTLLSMTIFVRLKPTELLAYGGSIIHSGGSAPSVNVSVSGTGVSATVFAKTPIGYASLNGSTTGGTGGLVTTVTTLAELVSYAKSCENNTSAKILYIKGKISASSTTVITIKHGANISVFGEGNYGELENVGLMFWDYKNVIVRNMKIHEVYYPNDALNIDECQNVWIDHNELYSKMGTGITVDTYDGLLDIKSGSRYVTVSWNYLHHHMKCSLIGHTDNIGAQAEDSQMKITYHHNWFSNTDGRNPSIRFGTIHMFNNYFEDVSDYGIAARDGAHAKIENSHYHNVKLPMVTDKFPVSGLPNGYIYETGNMFSGTCGTNAISQKDTAFWNSTTLPYAYTLDAVENVASIVKLLAGIGITTSVAQSAPDAPHLFELQQNFPNPFNPITTIGYTLEQNCEITLAVYDVLGNIVRTLVHQKQAPGVYTVHFDGSGVCSGIYFYRLNSGSFSAVKKFALMK